jgi:hypothetical protein
MILMENAKRLCIVIALSLGSAIVSRAEMILSQNLDTTGAYGSSAGGRCNGPIGDPFRDAAQPGGLTDPLLDQTPGVLVGMTTFKSVSFPIRAPYRWSDSARPH